MTVQFLLATLTRWVSFAAMAALVGGGVLEVFILPLEPPDIGDTHKRLRRLGIICLIVLVATSAGELLTRAQTMAAGGFAAAITAIPSVLTHTHFGMIWIARFVMLALALLVSPMPRTAARLALLILALAVTATTSLTGHAADSGNLTPSVAIDWIHVISVSTWAGGLLCLALCVLGPARAWPIAILGPLMQRFSRVAGLCLLAVVVTGGYSAWTQLGDVSTLWTTVYGRVLVAKLFLVLGLVWWGAVNRYTIVARLPAVHPAGAGERLFRLGRLALRRSARIARQALSSRLCVYVRREAVLVLLVFGCTAVLVDSTPARHAGHERHQVMLEPGQFRVSMEELHASGGVPPGWIFVPPAGDATRGREVFIRLRCYACHRVKGEKLPASSGVGPDLTGVGKHHPPGYLLESILNPDAVIVDERGYTGADGKSIMPDFRKELSTSDLIDLVSYLKTL